MPTISDNAICIRRWDFSETSQTVSLFTREHGIIRGLAKGAKRAKGRFSGGIDVLTRGNVVAILKSTNAMATITEWALLDPFLIIRTNLSANRTAVFMADAVHHLIQEHDPHPIVFDAINDAIERISGDNRYSEVLLTFQWQLLEDTGFAPTLDRDVSSGASLCTDRSVYAFDPEEGGFVADVDGLERWRVRASTIRILQQLHDRMPLRDEPLEAITRATRLLASYICHQAGVHLPSLTWVFPGYTSP